jgi:hypothetical protein
VIFLKAEGIGPLSASCWMRKTSQHPEAAGENFTWARALGNQGQTPFLDAGQSLRGKL